MLINPYREKITTIPGTRFLEGDLGLSGHYVVDIEEPARFWRIQWLLSPIPGRALGGVRAKLIDQKDFITFCNQRDLEVLLRYGSPGQYCHWTGKNYVGVGDIDWHGLCCDEEDLTDDLHERECRLREEYAKHGYQWLPTGLEIRRRVHLGKGRDVEELYTLLWDMDKNTQAYPDPRLETIHQRWARVERNALMWERT